MRISRRSRISFRTAANGPRAKRLLLVTLPDRTRDTASMKNGLNLRLVAGGFVVEMGRPDFLLAAGRKALMLEEDKGTHT